jgi:hypothetical protein
VQLQLFIVITLALIIYCEPFIFLVLQHGQSGTITKVRELRVQSIFFKKNLKSILLFSGEFV